MNVDSYYEPPEPTRAEQLLFEEVYEALTEANGEEPRDQDVWDEVDRIIEEGGRDE